MSDFDPSTSFLLDHELLDFVETATWEQPRPLGVDPIRSDGFQVRREDINNPDFYSLTVGIGITPSTTVFVCWAPVPSDGTEAIAFNPRPGHILVVGETETRWVIESQKYSKFGRWIVACNLEPQNAEPDS